VIQASVLQIPYASSSMGRQSVNKLRKVGWILIVAAIALCSIVPATAFSEITKNTHVYAMIEIDRICRGESKATGQLTRVAIYRSNKGKYYTYMMSTAGQIFGPEGGSKKSQLDGAEMVSELYFSGNNISYVERGTKSAGSRTAIVRMDVELVADKSSCSVQSCSMEASEAGSGSVCQFRCWPIDCEIRQGPAS
jgi:hypothetical protein